MSIITTQQLVDFILSRNGQATIVSFTTKTELRHGKGIKKSCPWPVIHKVSQINGVVNYDYEKAVNRQREREDHGEVFQAEQRQWGTRLDPAFVIHNGQLYLTIKIERTLDAPRYFTPDGKEIDAELVKPHLYAKSKSKRQETDKEIITRDYGIKGFHSARLMGEKFEIIPGPAEIRDPADALAGTGA